MHVLLAEMAALPSAYILAGALAFLWKSCSLKVPLHSKQARSFGTPPDLEPCVHLLSYSEDEGFVGGAVAVWKGTAGVTPPASSDLSQPRFYSPVRDKLPFDTSSLCYLHSLYCCVSSLLLFRGQPTFQLIG